MRHRVEPAPDLLLRVGDPRRALADWLGRSRCGEVLLVDFSLTCNWLPDSPQLPLTALYHRLADTIELAVTDRPLVGPEASASANFERWVREQGLARVRPGQALSLAPCEVAKPWGRELWYTGVERRGVSAVCAGGGQSPLPWVQAALPEGAAGGPGEPLILLKILDPLPEPVRGDLYFELHHEKREVYVVTHVDRSAWPDGTGYIRYGFSADALQRYADPEAFRRAYLDAVLAYEAVRRRLDADPPESDPALAERERRLRERMDSFTHLRPLRVGDVVKVPLRLPHSLQHGVRTVEFQTPVYERQILSFAQKVLTQDHWDTRAAVSGMLLQAPPAEARELLHDRYGVVEERIVDFSDFEVRRIRLAGTARHRLGRLSDYRLLMVVSGQLELDGLSAGPEQALLLPAGWEGELASAAPGTPLTLLLALPR